MGTHPIFESDFDCLTEMLGSVRFFRLTFRSLIKVPVLSGDVKVTQFARTKGPGGQHVNRKATAVEVRFPLFNTWMSEKESSIISEHLRRTNSEILNNKGEIVLICSDTRDPRKNRDIVVSRFESDMESVVREYIAWEQLKERRSRENNNPAKLAKAKSKIEKDQKWRKFTKSMRNNTRL